MTLDPPLDPSLPLALAAGIGMAPVAGALGCFVVWRRMAYFGDSLAHTALLGIALGLLGGFSTNLGTFIVCSVFALLLVWLQQKRMLATDTLLGIFAHVGLAVGMLTLSLLEQPEIDLHEYLFGDILTVRPAALYWIYGGSAIVLALLIANWPSLTLMTVHEGLAQAEGVKTFRMQLLLMLLMTAVVAISIRIVGILLIASLLIIPAATARQLARSPEAMTVFAALLGAVAVVIGILGSVRFDTPSGPSIVTVAALFFALLLPLSLLARRRG
ncbi:MAG: metal ABC transporter permease [Gammaproteobacteria bacterium]|nr:metal ABC transporter permease [Gammaproteobacteria bacterium]MDD9863537.1 metal ABC transporter permease [Gammaproteobacteria bacterium]